MNYIYKKELCFAMVSKDVVDAFLGNFYPLSRVK